jgi:malate dehydrogenase (decarboxylating)
MFNDDIQGTAATVLAGLYRAMKAQGPGPEALKDQTILVCGAGSAGSGVILTIRNALMHMYNVHMHMNHSLNCSSFFKNALSKKEAINKFYIVDERGLIFKAR